MRTMSTRKALSVMAAGVLTASLASGIGAGGANAASGTVKCGSGAVVGMWIQAKDSKKSGWAWTPNDGSKSQQWLRKELGPNDEYKVRVGCGGSPNKWDKSVGQYFWSGWKKGNASFYCYVGNVFSGCS